MVYEDRLWQNIEGNGVMECDNEKEGWQKMKLNILNVTTDSVGKYKVQAATWPNRSVLKELAEIKEKHTWSTN